MKENDEKAEWVQKNIVDENMSGFIEYMSGDLDSKLYTITDDLSGYDPDYILDSLKKIIDINNPEKDQLHITNVPGHEDDPYYSYGSLVADLSRTKEEIMPNGSKKWMPHFYDKPIAEESFTSYSYIFRGTVFMDIATKLQSRYKIGRLRVMIQPRSHCLTWHLDAQPRLHYPIKTQKGCFMIVNDEMRHLQQGVSYMVDTTHYHTAVNASRENRIHIVANILK